ncbi:ribosome-associated translation inhibitor RaiA [Pseudonocardiaceae bacterium YIM PH 21723]|nr:ribosome-associated translation inhibitor RaiA [Pseudonocardiaceae bacterium YIM PH 21723]
MEIVVKGRNVEIPDHYRVHVTEKMARLERYDRKVIRFDVELFHEPNPRQSKRCQTVEITGVGRGPVIRAQACAADFYAALDAAVNKLESRLRRSADRRRVHYGRKNRTSVAEATAPMAMMMADEAIEMNSSGKRGRRGRVAVLDKPADMTPEATEYEEIGSTQLEGSEIELPRQRLADEYDTGLPGQIAREKEHSAKPMTVDEALSEMELVGHDFYLFSCADSGRPSVVYRRKGFDYGLISLV